MQFQRIQQVNHRFPLKCQFQKLPYTPLTNKNLQLQRSPLQNTVRSISRNQQKNDINQTQELNQTGYNDHQIPKYLMYASGFQIFLDSICSSASAQESSDAIFQPGFSKESYYVTLGLFVLSLPGLWSLIKRAPQAKVVRKTFEVAGPKQEGPTGLDRRARQIFGYFKNYNYNVKETGDVIVFEGTYQASRGQAAALVFYVFIGLGSTALVCSIAFPSIGNWWYAMTLLSPLAWFYYFQRGTRQEEVRVKMVTADDENTTDIVIEGDQEEIDRFRRELELMEKGKVYVKGVLEQ